MRQAVKRIRPRREVSRNASPFVFRNRQRLEEAYATAVCWKCGYKGTSMSLQPLVGRRGPAQMVQSSEVAFLRALKNSRPVCYNCSGEERVAKLHQTKPCVVVGNPPHTLIALSAQAAEEERSGRLNTLAELVSDGVVAASESGLRTRPLPDSAPPST